MYLGRADSPEIDYASGRPSSPARSSHYTKSILREECNRVGWTPARVEPGARVGQASNQLALSELGTHPTKFVLAVEPAVEIE